MQNNFMKEICEISPRESFVHACPNATLGNKTAGHREGKKKRAGER